jgi:hypothetical protein
VLCANRHARGEAEAWVDGVLRRAERARHRDEPLAALARRDVLVELGQRFSERDTLGD